LRSSESKIYTDILIDFIGKITIFFGMRENKNQPKYATNWDFWRKWE